MASIGAIVRTVGERFDLRIERDTTKPLTFGAGIHYCLGANLARAEMQEAVHTTYQWYACVRNPYARFRSAHHYMKRMGMIKEAGELLETFGLKEGSNAEPGDYVLERAFVG